MLWTRLFNAVDKTMQSRLWEAVIVAVAESVLVQNGHSRDDVHEIEDVDDFQGELDCLINQWLDESIPNDVTLINWLGERDYFTDREKAWNERLSLTGTACPSVEDEVYDLTNRIPPHVVSADGITVDVVEDFYATWRGHFLDHVINTARLVDNSGERDSSH